MFRGLFLAAFRKDINKITSYYKKLIKKTKKNESVGTINEWIIDNYYVISELENYIKGSYWTPGIYKIPRKRKRKIYSLLYRYLSESDFNFNISYLFKKLNKYQVKNKDYFSYYEVDYIYIIIRMILVSELSLLTKKLDDHFAKTNRVNKIFEIINEKIRSGEDFNFNDYFRVVNGDINKHAYTIEQFSYKIKETGPIAEKLFNKLNEFLLKHKSSLREIIKESHTDVALDNLKMMNIFNSLKRINRYRIEYIYKNINFAEKKLVNEKAGIYDQLYDNNKGDLRLKIIKKAKKKKISEYQYTIELVKEADKEKKHVGWLLIDKSNYNLRAKVYIGTIFVVTILLSYYLSIKMGLLSLFLLLIPISNLVKEVVDKILIHTVRCKSIPKIKFEEGIPKKYSTMVVIATIATDKNRVIKMFDNLEVYYLSNKSDNLYFTLLGDASSEKAKHVEKDKEIVEAGINKVNELNEKYGRKIFHFVYRNRFYSEGEGCYLGYERKRGALLHFNKLLLGRLTEEQKKDYFKCHTFDNFNVKIKYVITLDADTRLVLNSAFKLIGAMVHPMNRPVLSKNKDKVISGYGMLQPRISIDVIVTNKSQYAQLFAGLGGLDIYTTAYFDLYQDVFNEGSFAGKGIYDLKVFDDVLGDAFPENLILSHDLIEGNYIRSGFVGDVELFDDFPASYLVDAARHHRWNRGDWQIIRWLKDKVVNKNGKVVKNPINFLGKWKVFDNLRRSMVSFFLLLTLFYGFTIGGEKASYYLTLSGIIIATPIFFYLLSRVLYRRKYDVFLKYYLNLIKGLVAVINKSFIVLSVLPYESYLYVDSAVKALYRQFISKKNLLNWVEAAKVEQLAKHNFKVFAKAFRINYLAAILLLLGCYFYKPIDMPLAITVAVIWFFAPILMYVISGRIVDENRNLGEKEQEELREIAERTWKFFEDYFKEEYHYLIPDNYQGNREEKADYRTSPSNIGYSLLSIISSAELNIISKKKALFYIENIIKSVSRLEKKRGHLYNWYCIKTFEKLYPYFISSVDNGNFIATLYVVKGFLEKYGNKGLLSRVSDLIEEMDFSKLYNQDLDVFSIGYSGTEQTLSPYHYNNFASESRLTSYIAVAKGDVPYRHWFCLDKTLTKYKYYKGVASWAGTAFEYFMPLIFMKTFRHTLLDESYHFALFAQREFVKQVDSRLPWGISESAYNELDDSNNYKYESFGVPYLKLHDGSSYPIIISPYSSIMALIVNDKEVYNNIKKLKKLGMYGEYGFYDAYDYEDNVVIKSYYAHHQGMILSSIANYLKDNVIQEYFHSNKDIQSVEMLLKEKVQIETYIDLKIVKYKRYKYRKEVQSVGFIEYDKLNPVPELGVISNSLYTIVLNERGVGFSKYKNLQINRYRQIPTEDYGLFVYIRNLNTNKLWTNTIAPLNEINKNYKVVYASDRLKYIREDDGITTCTEITVTKDHNAEIRKLTFINHNNEDVELELTSYVEIIMCRNEEDITHRIFNSMTIHTEIDGETSSLIFSRQSRTKENTRYYVINRFFLDEEQSNNFEFETSRTYFVGRNNTVSNPDVIINRKPLSSKLTVPLDPIMSIRKKVKIKAGEKLNAYLLIGFGKSKEQVLEIAKTYYNELLVEKAYNLKTVFDNMRNSYINLTVDIIRRCNRMLKFFYQSTAITNHRNELLANIKLNQLDLWKFGISGDLPIIFIEISKVEDVSCIKQIIKAYEYFKSRGLYIDVCILNKEQYKKNNLIAKYIDKFLYQVNNLNQFDEDLPGNIYIIKKEDLPDEQEKLLKMVANIAFDASSPYSLDDQLSRLEQLQYQLLQIDNKQYINNLTTDIDEHIEFYNKYGGFINEGKEYLINTINTPVPWINIIANDNFGTIVTNKMGGFTYAYNSREYKLTAWSNDITSDPISEKIVINNNIVIPSIIKHGLGYSLFYSNTQEYELFLKLFVDLNKKMKFYELTINNKTTEKTKLTIDLELNMVLGVTEELTNRYLTSHFDQAHNCLYLKNVYHPHFADKQVFISSTEKIASYRDDTNNKKISVNINLTPNGSKTFSFILGCDESEKDIKSYQNNKKIKQTYENIIKYWENKLNKVKVVTPDKAFNYALNNWYLYQVYASRLKARSAFYQVGGAYGYRDQLQDVLGIIYSNSEYAKKQILKHANHQFKEGDVLHFWHEEINFGTRTKFSDDYLWLVYVTYEYIKITGDHSILDEKVGFVTGPALTPLEDVKGINYKYTQKKKSLYEHLKLSINLALSRFGRHGLPLMGSGDWNDGMNKVGYKGKGESVFVGMFLCDLLPKVAELSHFKKDYRFKDLCLTRQKHLKRDINKNAWDGRWYLRAYYDNGIPLGSRNNAECQIDLLCQAWAILSDIAPNTKKEKMLTEVEKRLIDNDTKIIKLLTPPFDKTENNPGYIKDYPVGVRENGGQYTHAALWYINALLKEGKIDLANNYYQMINPINRSKTEEDINKYKVEPYVLAADIYANEHQLGRGGWTWYTGSASWAYKIGLEEILGFKKQGDELTIEPKIKKDWKEYIINYQYLNTTYNITVKNPNNVNSSKVSITVDGEKIDGDTIKLIDDKKNHEVIVVMEEK